jgi:hypothetical protein
LDAYSWLQGVGFVLLVAGSLTYSAGYQLSAHFSEPMPLDAGESHTCVCASGRGISHVQRGVSMFQLYRR